jgi:hypothetical protein
MWFRKRESDIEMSGMMDEAPKKKKTPQGPPEETEYLKFDWKRFFLAPKYIRKSASRPCDHGTFWLTQHIAWHILFIVIGILTVIITIKHDEVVEVSFALFCFGPDEHVTNSVRVETTAVVRKSARPTSRMVDSHCYFYRYFLPPSVRP